MKRILCAALLAAFVVPAMPEPVEAVTSTQLAKFKQPKQTLFLPELPRNTMGKVQKKALRESYAGLFSNG
jgi:malonyl-CoA/methylmalonyl-CoA synthetase